MYENKKILCSPEELASTLMIIRNNRLRNDDETIKLMSAFAGKECVWTHDQCADFFRDLLTHYVGDRRLLEILLMASGYGNDYSGLHYASQRRERYLDKHPDDSRAADSLKRSENNCLKSVAKAIVRDFEHIIFFTPIFFDFYV